MKQTTFEELIRDTAALEERLSAPADFHASRQEPYHKIAITIARRILLASKPEATDQDRWEHKVERTLDRITTHLMLGGAGLILSISDPPDPQGDLSAKDQRPGNQLVTHADVVEWIRAGLAGLEGGKRLTPRDYKILADSGENSLATIVMRAYYAGRSPANYVRLRRVIQRYLHGAAESTSTPLLDAVATAWAEHFSVRYEEDLREYVGRVVRIF